jgi:hypothetical protein
MVGMFVREFDGGGCHLSRLMLRACRRSSRNRGVRAGASLGSISISISVSPFFSACARDRGQSRN